MDKKAKIYVAGHRGLAGGAVLRELQSQGFENILTRTHAELDLTNQADTDNFFQKEQPEYVVLAAALVGGLFDNKNRPADFLATNLKIQTNTIDAAYRNGCKKFVFLGSSCIYPRIPDRLIKEEDILTAPLEETNKGYAVAKIAGTVMAHYYRQQYGFNAITVMPPNLIGPGDNFDPEKSHVAQGLMVRMHNAKKAGDKTFTVWGSGTPRREYLHSSDLAKAIVFLLANDTGEQSMFNIGTGHDHSIMELCSMIQKIVGYEGDITTDPSKPDGTPRKTMDTSKIFSLGWRPQISISEMLEKTYDDFLQSQ
ncbi:MAG: GDP-L-fucose synthase [Blastochloris viridis]|uniref:GDP-L-fucose synthase n=1 Tax=Blastochloris viridis TaxID=1079 RepID=A0A6N4RAV4_BLAVI|nr:MAG: GDP-L-fucose synthase [Blastochloris viridis]